ncbi:class I SAM-dependent methyltransferase [Paenibacillus sp. SEL3]
MIEITFQNNEVKLMNTQNNVSETVLHFGGIHNNLTTISSPKLLQEYIHMLENYSTIQKYTYGETTMIDIVALTSLVYSELMAGKHSGIRALEVGSWFGCSSYFFANSLKTFSDSNFLFCMDTWQGSPDTASHNIANYENAFEHFKSVMRYAGVYDNIKPIVCDSTVGMDILQDDYFDIIFVDANHTYEYVYQDIVKGIRKIKVGGLLMGHDCECYADELPPHLLQGDNKHLDGVEGYHTGVIKALDDIFGRSYSRFNHSLVWYKRITQEDKDMFEKKTSKYNYDREGLVELAETMKEAIQYIYNNISEGKSDTLQTLTVDTVQAAHQLEKEMLPLCENFYNKELKINTNMLKSALLDFQITYNNDFPQALSVLESKVIERFNVWLDCFLESEI